IARRRTARGTIAARCSTAISRRVVAPCATPYLASSANETTGGKYVSGTQNRDLSEQAGADQCRDRRDTHVQTAERPFQSARPADVGHGTSQGRSRGGVHGEPQRLLRGGMGGTALGSVPHERESVPHCRRGRLHHRQLRGESAGRLSIPRGSGEGSAAARAELQNLADGGWHGAGL